jgi:hypothetical protein
MGIFPKNIEIREYFTSINCYEYIPGFALSSARRKVREYLPVKMFLYRVIPIQGVLYKIYTCS